MKCTSQISVSNFFHKDSLVTREVASLLMKKISECPWEKVHVDFSGITFISRSFADQFHKEKIDLFENGEKEVICDNMLHDVKEMFKAVCKTQEAWDREYNLYPVLHFTTRRSLIDYLQSV